MDTDGTFKYLMGCDETWENLRSLYYEVAREYVKLEQFDKARDVLDRLSKGRFDNKSTLSVCMIVRDEESNLFDSLRSVYDVADEIVIVDTGSIDRTKEVAGIFGAKIFDFPWTGNFSEARNYSIRQATGDWVLIMDADEVISGLDFKVKVGAAYSFTTRNYIQNACVIGWTAPEGGGGYGWITSAKVRLFQRLEGIYFSNPVHELVEPSLTDMGIPVLGCEAIVHHYGKLDIERDRKKGEVYYTLGKAKYDSDPADVRSVIELAKQAQGLGKNEEAIKLYWELIELMKDKSNYNKIARVSYGDPLSEVYIQLAAALLFENRFQEALWASRAGVKNKPLREYVNVNAHCEIVCGSLDSAQKRLEDVLNDSPDYNPALILMAAVRCLKGEHHVFPKSSEEILKLCVAHLRLNKKEKEAELLTRRESTMVRAFRGLNKLKPKSYFAEAVL